MQRIPGTDLWILQLRGALWDKAFLSCAWVDLPQKPDTRISLKHWRGLHAPLPPAKANKLQGILLKRTLHSDSLGMDRELTVYLPPQAPKRGLPAFFMADGQGCESFAQVLEPLILSGRVKPAAIIGVHSGAYTGPAGSYDPTQDRRGLEYIPGEDPTIFAQHLIFFTQEVPAYVAKEFGVSQQRKDRAVFGFSNGGAFAAAAALAKPEVFANTLPMSLGVSPATIPKLSHPPMFHFAAGELEHFKIATTNLRDKLQAQGVPTSLDIYMSGHDPAMWQMAFANLAPQIFPPKKE